MNLGPVEVLLFLPIYLVPFLLAYWLIRLAVRHGTLDAHRRMREWTPLPEAPPTTPSP